MRLIGKDVYLDTLEREDCRALWSATEYDFEHPYEALVLGLSQEGADKWFEEIQAAQGKTHVRLGIFLSDGSVVGDAALQDIDWRNRSCSVGMGFAKIEHRGRGYGAQALALLLGYAFDALGLERVWARTLAENVGARKSLAKCGFAFEGTLRRAEYLNGAYRDQALYAILREEWAEKARESVFRREGESIHAG